MIYRAGQLPPGMRQPSLYAKVGSGKAESIEQAAEKAMDTLFAKLDEIATENVNQKPEDVLTALAPAFNGAVADTIRYLEAHGG